MTMRRRQLFTAGDAGGHLQPRTIRALWYSAFSGLHGRMVWQPVSSVTRARPDTRETGSEEGASVDQ